MKQMKIGLNRVISFGCTKLLAGCLVMHLGFGVEVGQKRKLLHFIGNGSSGTTIVASIINLHPQALVANEARSANKYLDNPIEYMRCIAKKVRGQGSSEHIDIESYKLIGNKLAGYTAHCLMKDPVGYVNRLEKLSFACQAELCWLVVQRNPFDAIATAVLRWATKKDYGNYLNFKRSGDVFVFKDKEDWDRLIATIDTYFAHEEGIGYLRKYCPGNIYVLYHEDLLDEPRQTICRLSKFLGLEPYTDYLDEASSEIHPQASRKDLLVWRKSVVELIKNRMSRYPWLKRYLNTEPKHLIEG